MIQALRSYFYYLIALLCLASCQKSCAPETKMSADKRQAELNLNYQSLSKEQIANFNKLLDDEISPCGCPKTFAQCLSNKDECEPARLLADWALGHLKNNVPERALFQAVSDEINKGYMSEPLNVKIEGANHKGKKDAPITVIEFADFECPACKLASRALSKVLADRPDEIQVYFMHFPLNIHPQAEAAAVAAEAAAKQNKFWQMHDALFAHEGALSEKAIHQAAVSIFSPHELLKFEKDLQDPALLKKVRAQKDHAQQELKLGSTPTFLFNNRQYNLSLAEDGFLLRVAMEKARSGINCQNH